MKARAVELRAARIPLIGPFAHHHWLVVDDGLGRVRWEVWQRPDVGGTSWGHLHRDLMPWDAGVGNGPSWVLQTWEGSAAERLAARLATAPQQYPWRHRYRYWPGPNSNTFVQWVLEDAFRLPWQGIGRRYAPGQSEGYDTGTA